MRRLFVCLSIAFPALLAAPAAADDAAPPSPPPEPAPPLDPAAPSLDRIGDPAAPPAPAPEETPAPPPPLELGLYTGGFINNYYHQFYDPKLEDLNVRPEYKRVSAELGVRGAYFPMRWIGGEIEATWILGKTKPGDSASIYGLRWQVIAQYPLDKDKPLHEQRIIPYVALGEGLLHVSSPITVLGSDTDWPIHIGGGVRVRVHPMIMLRADLRFIRGPSFPHPDYTLNASYGEFMIGASWTPAIKKPPPPPPPPPVEKDTDGDGILDKDDKCPTVPEDKDLFDDTDGCPDPDNDGDGVPDDKDKCPTDPEDKDGFEDDDGCPDKDNDGDGINDAQDKCPNEPEDKDNFQDADGCPDPDNDGDGFPDAVDKCPNEAEVINGNADDDGCPDRGDALVVVSPDRLELLEAIQWTKAKDPTLAKQSTNVLTQIAATLRAHGEILRLRITVHVQPTKDADKDQQLTDKRAEVLRKWLVDWGIDEKRLEPRGFGGTKPLVPPDQKGSAAINERIDLIILERK